LSERLSHWQETPLRHFKDCPCDGDLNDIYEGSLSALREFLRMSEKEK
jgi:hypothetical protein